MSAIGTGYDVSAMTYSPAGRVFQVEYAGKAVENSGTAIGLRCKDGVVFALENIVTSPLHERTNRRTYKVTKQLGIASAGLVPDSRWLADEARADAQSYFDQYGTPITAKILNERMSDFVHARTIISWERPVGCSIMIGGYDEYDGPALYMCDPSGVSYGYHGCAIGKGQQAAHAELEKLKLKDATCKEMLKEAARIIYSVHDEVKDKEFELEMAWISPESGHQFEVVPAALQSEAVAFAKAAMDDDDDEDEDDA